MSQVASYDEICKVCGLCKEKVCFSLSKDLAHTFELPERLPQTYSGARFTSDAMDCSLPIALDSHSGCSYGCCYCFANNLSRSPDRSVANLQKKIREGSFYAEWSIGKLERFLNRELKGKMIEPMYPVLDSGCPVQLGALGDPFDELEAHSGWAKKAIPLFIKYKIPVRVGTKGGRLLQRPEYLKLFESSPDQFWFAFSIISNSDELISKVDIKAPVTSERLDAMKALTKLGCHASIRLRPFLPGISDSYPGEPQAWKTLILRARASGARAMSFEYIFLHSAPTEKEKALYRLMFRIMGNPHFDKEWAAASGVGESCRRSGRLYKYEMTRNVRDLVKSLGMSFGCSDPHFKEWNDTGSCFSAMTEVIVRRTHSPYVERACLLRLYENQQRLGMKFEVLCDGEWKKAKAIRIPYKKKWFKIILRNGASMLATNDHIHFTKDGEKQSKELVVGDFVLINSNGMPSDSQRGTYDMGRFIGLYLAEGSGVLTLNHGKFGFCFGQHEKRYYDFVYSFVTKLGGFVPPWEQTLYKSWSSVNCHSDAAATLISEFVNGKKSRQKCLKGICFEMSKDFRRGLLDGWMEGDGRSDERLHKGADSASIRLVEDMFHIATTLGIPSSIKTNEQTNDSFYFKKHGRKKPGRRTLSYQFGICSLNVGNADRQTIAFKTNKIYQNKIHVINGQRYSQVVSIKEENFSGRARYAYCLDVEDGHRFQLANGIITHNCCGMPESGDKWFSNWSRRQMTEVVVQAKRAYERGEVRRFNYQDWRPDWAHEIPFEGCVALPSFHNSRILKDFTFGDSLRRKWNNPKHPRGPYHYFGGVLKPIGVDQHGDLVYEYDEWTKDFDRQFKGVLRRDSGEGKDKGNG